MNKKPLRKALQGPLMYLLILAVILLMVHMLSEGSQPTTESISYSTLLKWVEADVNDATEDSLPASLQGKKLGRVVIQSSTLMAVTKDNLASADMTGHYDVECVVPSEAQFTSPHACVYASVSTQNSAKSFARE